jgi:hypothetical protein
MNKKDHLKEKRRFIRHPMCFPLQYKAVAKISVPEEAVTTKNIGRGGLLFSATQAAREGAIILIKIPFLDKLFHVKAKVVWCDKVFGQELYDVGVAFQRVNDAFKVKLIEQLYLISEYRDLRSMQLGHEISLEEASREWIKRYSKRFKRLYW